MNLGHRVIVLEQQYVPRVTVFEEFLFDNKLQSFEPRILQNAVKLVFGAVAVLYGPENGLIPFFRLCRCGSLEGKSGLWTIRYDYAKLLII